MTYTKEQQEASRGKFIESLLDEAWRKRCRVSYIRGVQLPKVQAEVDSLTEQIGALDAEIAKVENGLEFHKFENREKVKQLRGERDALERQRNGTGKVDPRDPERSDRGLVGMIYNMNLMAIEKEAEADNQEELARYAETWKHEDAPAEKAATAIGEEVVVVEVRDEAKQEA